MTFTKKGYFGPLTAEQTTEGIAVARKNAARLIADADLLLESGRNASASALGILAIEELGKAQILKIIALQCTEADLKKAWKDYRDHRAKNVMWILPDLLINGAKTLIDVSAATDKTGEHTWLLNTLKQLSLYTDCFDPERWSEPSEVIDPKLASSIVSTAKLLNLGRVVQKREVELWIEIVSSHYRKPTLPDAVLAFQQRIYDEGLTGIPSEALERFMACAPQTK